jgi:hypothetical protein
MAHEPAVFQGPDTEEAFLADKLRFWNGIGKAITYTIIVVALLLIGMAVFL